MQSPVSGLMPAPYGMAAGMFGMGVAGTGVSMNMQMQGGPPQPSQPPQLQIGGFGHSLPAPQHNPHHGVPHMHHHANHPPVPQQQHQPQSLIGPPAYSQPAPPPSISLNNSIGTRTASNAPGATAGVLSSNGFMPLAPAETHTAHATANFGGLPPVSLALAPAQVQVQHQPTPVAQTATPVQGSDENNSRMEADNVSPVSGTGALELGPPAPLLTTSQGENQLSSNGKHAAKCAAVDMTPEERARVNRDRNREHARSTRLRKKAYVSKLKELVENLHAERCEETRKRRVVVEHLSEVQKVRRAVIRSFLRFHAGYESDRRKWMTILEDGFFLKQPVTPYRSFRRAEIEQVRISFVLRRCISFSAYFTEIDSTLFSIISLFRLSPHHTLHTQECRKSRGVEAMIADAASIAVMVEGIGSRSERWAQIKREEFLAREDAAIARAGGGTGQSSLQQQRQRMPHNITRQNSRLQHAVSSLSSSSESSTGNGSGEEEEQQQARRRAAQELHHQRQLHGVGALNSVSGGCAGAPPQKGENNNSQELQVIMGGVGVNKVSPSSSGSRQSSSKQPMSSGMSSSDLVVGGVVREILPPSGRTQSSNDFHDYHAPSLPDPMLDSGEGSTGSDSPMESRAGSDTGGLPEGRRRGTGISGNKHVCTDSSSGDEDNKPSGCPISGSVKSATKRRRTIGPVATAAYDKSISSSLTPPQDVTNVWIHTPIPASITNRTSAMAGHTTSMRLSTERQSYVTGSPHCAPQQPGLPPNIARSGGISHNIKPMAIGGGNASRRGDASINARLRTAPATSLPPFAGIGKRVPLQGLGVIDVGPTTATVGTAIVNKQSGGDALNALNGATLIGVGSIGGQSPSSRHPDTSVVGTVTSGVFSNSKVETAKTSKGETSSAVSLQPSASLGRCNVNPGYSSNPTLISSMDSSSTKGSGGGSGSLGSIAGSTDAISAALIASENDTSSSQSSGQSPLIQADYHVNEDDSEL